MIKRYNCVVVKEGDNEASIILGRAARAHTRSNWYANAFFVQANVSTTYKKIEKSLHGIETTSELEFIFEDVNYDLNFVYDNASVFIGTFKSKESIRKAANKYLEENKISLSKN